MLNLLKGYSFKNVAYFDKLYPTIYNILLEEYDLSKEDFIVIYRTNPMPKLPGSENKYGTRKAWSKFKTYFNGQVKDLKSDIYYDTWMNKSGHFRQWLQKRKKLFFDTYIKPKIEAKKNGQENPY
jgi:hypothetical protein